MNAFVVALHFVFLRREARRSIDWSNPRERLSCFWKINLKYLSFGISYQCLRSWCPSCWRFHIRWRYSPNPIIFGGGWGNWLEDGNNLTLMKSMSSFLWPAARAFCNPAGTSLPIQLSNTLLIGLYPSPKVRVKGLRTKKSFLWLGDYLQPRLQIRRNISCHL